jgi:RNA polymerase sigma factor (sigma-70 family)
MLTQNEWNYWYNLVFGYFYRRVNSRFDAEELTANTLNDFFLTDKQVENQKAFLWGIARHKFFDYLREKKLKPTNLNLDQIENSLKDSVDLEDTNNPYFLARIENLKKCIKNHLKDLDQEIVDLVVSGDFKCSFVAKELGISHSNVRQRLSRAIKKLKQNCTKFWNN